jgi:hypothetical protein
VHIAGISVRGRVGASESEVPDEELENWIVKWPGAVPKATKPLAQVKAALKRNVTKRAPARKKARG